MALRRWLTRVYLTADPRSLGAGRVVLAVLLLTDLVRRVPGMATWYTNDGLLPNHTVLWRPSFEPVFSFFFVASWPFEAAIGFVVCGLAYTMLLFGVRTRLAHVVSWVCLLSLHGRVLFVQNGGDVVLVELCTWTMFLPMGRRYSWDSLRARLRSREDRTADDLGRRADFAPNDAPVVSLAVLALTAQLAIIYAFNALQKTGPTWRAGSVVHYLLHSDGIVTTFGLWVRSWLTPSESRALTWTAWLLEAALPLVLLSPSRQRAARHLAMAMIVLLHGEFALLLNLGMFAPVMMGFLPFLIPAADWEALGRWWARRPAARIVIFDGDCGICFQIVRALARLDAGARLRFISGQSVLEGREAVADVNVATDRLAQTIVVVDPVTKRQWVRAAAFAEIAAMLPLGALFAWPLRLPGIRRLADTAYDAFAARRTDISIALGLAACGTSKPATPGPLQDEAPATTEGEAHPGEDLRSGPRANQDLGRGQRPNEELRRGQRPKEYGHGSPIRERLAFPPWRARPDLLREALIGFLVVLTTMRIIVDNPRLTHINRSWQPRWMDAATTYLQFFQSWAMFAPDAPITDTNLTVDATTVDGRHVDPLNEAASSHQPRPGLRIPPRLGQDGPFSAYILRLPWHGDYFGALTDWILRYPKRTGRGADEIVSFEVYYVEDDSPPPGEREPRNTRTTLLVKYPQ